MGTVTAEQSRAHYVGMMTTLDERQKKAAAVILLITAISVIPDWRKLAVVAVWGAIMLPWNSWATKSLLPARGLLVGEIVRNSVNVAFHVLAGHFLGWPAPVWMWLPFVAISFDGSRRVISYGVLVSMVVALTTCALADGVSWTVPLAWAGVAVLCRLFTDQRVKIAHDMMVASEESHAQLKDEVAARERIALELRQAQKLEAIGRLASGIAHEINNPLQYVASSVTFLEEGVASLGALISSWRSRIVESPRLPAELLVEALEAERKCDLAAVQLDLTESLALTQDGVDRVTAIVRAMKEFAHPDQKEKIALDLNRTISATLVVARHEYAHVADVATELGLIPHVMCHPGAISQVLLNLVVNAAHAVAANGTGRRGKITVGSMAAEEGWVSVTVTDDGCGIPDDIRENIFEPFFTTKPIGRGTGQGLAIARSIVESHAGTLTFRSTAGRGTTFTMKLPVAVARSEAA